MPSPLEDLAEADPLPQVEPIQGGPKQSPRDFIFDQVSFFGRKQYLS